MLNLEKLKQIHSSIIVIGSHPAIIQSILDFDYLSGKTDPSVKAILAGNRRFERYFFGKKELLIPVFSTIYDIPRTVLESITYFFNTTSGRRVYESTQEALQFLPGLLGGVIFAENVPEIHALNLFSLKDKSKKFIIGPSSVGLLIPSQLKLGAIGGVDYRQLIASDVFTSGNVAVFSASGGMTNEIIRIVTQQGKRLSFALSFGGDRFPILTPKDAFLAAEYDSQTEAILYFGEIGGTDEYDLAKLLQERKVTKKVICYIGGTVAELFKTPLQFGHAKAMAKKGEETARAKRDALRHAGVSVAESFSEFVNMIKSLPSVSNKSRKNYTIYMNDLKDRRSALITTSISYDKEGNLLILDEDLLEFTKSRSFASIVTSLFLGKKDISTDLEAFVDFTLRILVDHGPYVSGAVNTIITARSGRDLVSSLASGLLTIGPRFGGAINQAAANWLRGVRDKIAPYDFVEEFARRREYISGIGHRKYRVDLPDPRVEEIIKFVKRVDDQRFTNYAKAVEEITVAKKGNLILNIDGAIAAVLLDLLKEKEEMTYDSLQRLIDNEFFNALFVLSRSVGFIAHFLDQKRLDQGLFRLDEKDVAYIK
jgi:ATP citrate (pro-S)-lyase